MLDYSLKSTLISSNKPFKLIKMDTRRTEKQSPEHNQIVIKFLTKSKYRHNIYIIMSILTLGIVPLLFYWFENWRKYLFEITTEIEHANFILIENSINKKLEIVPLIYDSCKLLPHKSSKRRYFFIFKEHFYYFGKKGLKIIKHEMVENINKNPGIIDYYKKGLDNTDREAMHKVYGKNLINIKKESILWLTLREILSPFTIFQVLSIILWTIDDYALFAFIILVMMIMAIATTVYENHTQGLRMRRMTYINTSVQVLQYPIPGYDKASKEFPRFRHNDKNDTMDIEMQYIGPYNQQVGNIDSISLAIGDIVYVKQGDKLTSDVLILEGKALVNEAMLTGESVPVVKRSYNGNGPFGDVNVLFSGTECIMANKITGIVINTGFYTKKGEIIRNLLFNEQKEFEFKQDSFKLLIIIFFVVFFAFIWLIAHVKNSIYSDYYGNSLIFIRALQLFTVAVPPVLPLSLTIGLEIANRRLKRKNIYTLFLDKINLAGRVKHCCFDKTGTLTENLLKLKGIKPVTRHLKTENLNMNQNYTTNGEVTFSLFYDQLSNFEKDYFIKRNSHAHLLYECLGCCHSLQNLNGKLIGDPLEVQLFEESGFSLSQVSPVDNEEIIMIKPDLNFITKIGADDSLAYYIERTLEFTSERKRMSVVVSSDNHRRLFLKGAPEIVKGLCIKTTLPINFDEVLSEFTEQGLRVLAIAYKDIGLKESIASVEETDLNFMGFVVFENPLKPESKDTLLTLRQCGITSSIITGDNLLTALSVSISLWLFDYSLRVFVGDVSNGKVVWEEIENEKQRVERGQSLKANSALHDKSGMDISKVTSQNSFLAYHTDKNSLINTILEECEANNCALALTGDAFELLFKSADISEKKFQLLLTNTYVYARASPSQKAMIVKRYQEYYRLAYKDRWFVCFCGDGANDTEALKQADVGMSLSNSEALLAATFNTSRDNVSCLIDLFVEAKCSLENSLQNAKYVVYYSLLQFICVLFAYSKALEYVNMHYLYWDLFVFLPLSIFIPQTNSVSGLNPHYPSTTLFEIKFLISLLGEVGIASVFILLINIVSYSIDTNLEIYEIAATMPKHKDSAFYRETEALFFIAAMLSAWGAIIFSKGYPFKIPVWSNRKIVGWVALTTILTLIICYTRYMGVGYGFKYFIAEMFRLLEGEVAFVNAYVILTILCVICSILFEKHAVNRISKLIKKLI